MDQGTCPSDPRGGRGENANFPIRKPRRTSPGVRRQKQKTPPLGVYLFSEAFGAGKDCQYQEQKRLVLQKSLTLA